MNTFNLTTRLLARSITDPVTGCWVIQSGCIDKYGYGGIKAWAGSMGTHRVAYELWVGYIPEGMCVLHNCDTPACVNPSHLRLGTPADNVADRVARGRSARGERNGRAKLTWMQVDGVRASSRNNSVLARELGVDPKVIRNIRGGKSWKK